MYSCRKIQDLKDRYYAVQRKLMKARPHNPGEYPHERQALIQQYAFDKHRETERKDALKRMFDRSAADIEQERVLFIESRRIEQNEPRLSRDRDMLLNTLQLEQAQQAPLTPLTPTMATGAGQGASVASPVSPVSSLATPGGIGIAGGTASADMKKKKRIGEDSAGGANKKGRRVSNASSAGFLDGRTRLLS